MHRAAMTDCVASVRMLATSIMVLPMAWGRGGRWLAQWQPPLGHEATRGAAASPLVQLECLTPAVNLAVDMGVGGPMHGLQFVGITIRIVHSLLDSMKLSIMLRALGLRRGMRSGAVTAASLQGSFTDLVVIVLMVASRSPRAANTASSPSHCAEICHPPTGTGCPAGEAAPLPRAVLLLTAPSFQLAPMARTSALRPRASMGRASTHGFGGAPGVRGRSLRPRAVGTLALDRFTKPLVGWSRLSACLPEEAPQVSCITCAQAWASSQRR